MSTAPLSKTGARQLAAAEEKIERGLSTFVEVGDALSLIRDGRLYREDYGTFEDYCQGRWGFTSRRARQLMEAAEMGTIVPVSNEGQARELTGLSPDEVIEVYGEAQAEGDVTAAGLKAARKRRRPKQTPTETVTFDPAEGYTATSGSDQSTASRSDAAGSGDDERDASPAPSPAPKVAPQTLVTCPTCGGRGEIEATS